MIIVVDPVEPSPCSFRHPVGAALELDLTFLMPALPQTAQPQAMDLTDTYPQLVLIPRSQGNAYAYDIEVVSAEQGLGHVSIPGNFFNDLNGYDVELYTRDAEGHPTGLVAEGVARLTGGAYRSLGPLGPMTVPTIEGPAGPAGAPGQRGSIWLTGNGDPTITSGVLPGDMYLDNLTGNVWRWDGATWAVA